MYSTLLKCVFIYVDFNFSAVIYGMLRQFANARVAFTYWCLSHNMLFLSEFDDYSIVFNKLVIIGDFISFFNKNKTLKSYKIVFLGHYSISQTIFSPSNWLTFLKNSLGLLFVNLLNSLIKCDWSK